MMSQNQKWLLLGGGLVALVAMCCVGVVIGAAVSRNQQTSAVSDLQLQAIPESADSIAQAPSPAAPTAVPDQPPPPLAASPSNVRLQALGRYAEAIKPIVDQGLAAAERDNQVLAQAENNPTALCGGTLTAHPTLVADATTMSDLAQQLDEIEAPAETAAYVHRPLTDSVTLWAEALDNINRSCQTSNQAERDLRRLGAMLQLGGSIINFQMAVDHFWHLVVQYGLEALVGPAP